MVARVAAAQEPDGYLNTRFGRPGQGARWSDLEWGHELYCLGHLFQAAVARVRTRPDADDGLVDVARRAADLVCEVFGEGGDERICGHAEVEVGLAELGRALGEPRYLEQARLFVERHGEGTLRDIEWGRSYYQDDQAVRDADVLRGHSVRANYLAAGAADVAIETGDDELLHALDRQWDTTVERRTYVTGGQGSHHQDEAFGEDWELPSDRAYSETCAGVASVMFSWRLLLAQGDARYADLIERTLFNVIETSPSAEGTAFYYANTLHQRRPGAVADADTVSPRAQSSLRAPWFDVSCCPPNTARTFASLAAYIATADASGVQLHQYAPASIRTTLDGGQAVALDVATEYPRSGSVRVRVLTDAAEPWTLSLRVPGVGRRARGRSCARPTAGPSRCSMPTRTAGPAPSRSSARSRRATRSSSCSPSFPGSPRPTRGSTRCADASWWSAVPRCSPSSRSTSRARRSRHPTSPTCAWTPASPRGTTPTATVVATIVDERTGARAEVPLVRYHDWAERGPSQMRVWVPVVGA